MKVEHGHNECCALAFVCCILDTLQIYVAVVFLYAIVGISSLPVKKFGDRDELGLVDTVNTVDLQISTLLLIACVPSSLLL